jgi:putative hydrolase of the HAD superfamily
MTDRALVLDFGGVISRTMFETHPLTEKALGLAPSTLTWQGPFAPETDELWQSMQRDEITERDYWTIRAKETGQLVGKGWSKMADFVVAARAAHPLEIIRPEFLQTIKTAKTNGARLAILSNELDLFYGADFKEKLPFMADFECIVDATYTGILKPDPRAYQLIFDQMNIAPAHCVFVDDQRRNTEGARKAGMNIVHFDVQHPNKSYAEALTKLGISAVQEA